MGVIGVFLGSLIVCHLLPWSVSGDTFGNVIIPGKKLVASPRSYMLSNHHVPSGFAIAFRFFSIEAGLALDLEIWRPQGGNRFLLVGAVNYVTSQTGTVEVLLGATVPAIETKFGDLPGFSTHTTSVPVAYTVDPFHEGAFVQTLLIPQDGRPQVGKNYTFTGDFFDKKFALNVEVSRERPTTPRRLNTMATTPSTAAVRTTCDVINGGCHQTCSDLNSGATCGCKQGYKLAKNGMFCDDVDECVVHPGSCDDSRVCVNTPGSYVCIGRPIETVIPGSAASKKSMLSLEPITIAILVWLFLLTVLLVLVICLFWCVRRQNSDLRLIMPPPMPTAQTNPLYDIPLEAMGAHGTVYQRDTASPIDIYATVYPRDTVSPRDVYGTVYPQDNLSPIEANLKEALEERS